MIHYPLIYKSKNILLQDYFEAESVLHVRQGSAHIFSACELLKRFPSQNDLPPIKMPDRKSVV